MIYQDFYQGQKRKVLDVEYGQTLQKFINSVNDGNLHEKQKGLKRLMFLMGELNRIDEEIFAIWQP